MGALHTVETSVVDEAGTGARIGVDRPLRAPSEQGPLVPVTGVDFEDDTFVSDLHDPTTSARSMSSAVTRAYETVWFAFSRSSAKNCGRLTQSTRLLRLNGRRNDESVAVATSDPTDSTLTLKDAPAPLPWRHSRELVSHHRPKGYLPEWREGTPAMRGYGTLAAFRTPCG